MTRLQQKFHILREVPTDADQAKRLGLLLTNHFGARGWELVAMTAIGGGRALLLAFQKPMPGDSASPRTGKRKRGRRLGVSR
jgi:hypothetical protein